MLDADCIVAGTLARSGAASRLLDLWQSGDFELIACAQLIREVREALLGPRIRRRYGIPAAEVEDLCKRLEEDAIWLSDPRDPPRIVPNDSDDDYLVALALEAKADVLVRRDRHFDGVAVPGLRIVFPGVVVAELEERHGSEP